MKAEITCNFVLEKPIKTAGQWWMKTNNRWKGRYSTPTNFMLNFDYVSLYGMGYSQSRRVYVTQNNRFFITVEKQRCDVTDFCKGLIVSTVPEKPNSPIKKSPAPACLLEESNAPEKADPVNLAPADDEVEIKIGKWFPIAFVLLKIALYALIALFIYSAFFSKANAVEISDDFLNAIAKVESRGNDCAVGDKGNALGRYQIWNSYVQDANRIGHYRYTHNDAKNAASAKKMVTAYLTHYGKRYERMTGKKATNEVLAKIHNGGPNGWRKMATNRYWGKVRAELHK